MARLPQRLPGRETEQFEDKVYLSNATDKQGELFIYNGTSGEVPLNIYNGSTRTFKVDYSGAITASGPLTLDYDTAALMDLDCDFTSGNLIDIKSTPTSASTAVIVTIEADGTNWGSGSACLKLISDNANAFLITGWDTSTRQFYINNVGSLGLLGNIELVSGGSILTTSNGNLTLIPDGTGITVIGDAGSTSHGLAVNDDLFVSGRLEVDGVAYFDGFVYFATNTYFADNAPIALGTGIDTYLYWATNQTSEHTILFGLGDTAKSIIFCDKIDTAKNFDHAAQSNPTLFIHSATDPDTVNTQWVSIAHNQTDGVIDCGTGTLNLGGTANVNFAGATATAATVTHDAYVELEVAGVLKKFMLGS